MKKIRYNLHKGLYCHQQKVTKIFKTYTILPLRCNTTQCIDHQDELVSFRAYHGQGDAIIFSHIAKQSIQKNIVVLCKTSNEAYTGGQDKESKAINQISQHVIKALYLKSISN